MKINHRTFKLSLVALGLGLTTSSWAAYVLYQSDVYSNPIRTEADFRAYVQAFNNHQPKDSGYTNTYGAVSTVSEGGENNISNITECIICLGTVTSPGSTSFVGQELEIQPNRTFTLSKSFKDSNVFNLNWGSKLKFHQGEVRLNPPISLPSSRDDTYALTAFEARDRSELEIKNVKLTATTDSTGFVVYNDSTANLDNVSINMSGNGLLGLDIDNSTLNMRNSQLSLDTSTATGSTFMTGLILGGSKVDLNNVTLTLKDKIGSQKTRQALAVVDSEVNIIKSIITAENVKMVAFTNAFNEAENGEKFGKTTINITDSTIQSPAGLFNVRSLLEAPDEDDEPEKMLPISFNINNSELVGDFIQSHKGMTTPIHLTITNGNNKDIITYGKSVIQNLHNDNANIQVVSENAATPNYNGTFTIEEKLTGNGTFTLQANLATQQSTKLIVKGTAEGTHRLNLVNVINPTLPNGSVTLVETGGGTAIFRLMNNAEYVDYGAYRYRLRKEGNNWVLSNRQAEAGNGNSQNNQGGQGNQNGQGNQGGQGNQNNPATPTQIVNLSETANGLISLRQAQLIQLEQNLPTLHQRLGDMKKKGSATVWVRNTYTQANVKSSNTSANSYSSGFKQDQSHLQIGTDFAVNKNFTLGGFVGRSRSHIDFNGEYGSAKLNAKGAGIYATFQWDNGLYWDNIYQYERLTLWSPKLHKHSYNGHTISTEIGKHHFVQDWTITPQLQLAWSTVSGRDNVERLSSLYSRTGVRVSKTISLNHHWKIYPYAEINAMLTQHHQGQVRIANETFEVSSHKSRIATGLGVALSGGNHHIGVQLSNTQGKYIDNPISLQAIYRYQW